MYYEKTHKITYKLFYLNFQSLFVNLAWKQYLPVCN